MYHYHNYYYMPYLHVIAILWFSEKAGIHLISKTQNKSPIYDECLNMVITSDIFSHSKSKSSTWIFETLVFIFQKTRKSSFKKSRFGKLNRFFKKYTFLLIFLFYYSRHSTISLKYYQIKKLKPTLNSPRNTYLDKLCQL